MKKLMLAAAIVCAAAIANASTAKWSASNIQASPAGSYVGGVTEYAAYVFEGTDVGAITSLLLAGDFDSFEAADFSNSPFLKTATSATPPKMNWAATALDGDQASKTLSLFVIVVDASSAADADNFLVLKDSNGAQVITKTFGTTGDITYTFGTQAENTNWQSIPEPTSGLLLLLGVAGLALRRRRA